MFLKLVNPPTYHLTTNNSLSLVLAETFEEFFSSQIICSLPMGIFIHVDKISVQIFGILP